MIKLIDDSLLQRFLQKETSDTENNEIFQWLLQSKENHEKFRQVHQVWHLSRLKQYQSEIDVDEAWSRLYRQLPKLTGKRVFSLTAFFWKVAASVAIILAVGFGSLWTHDRFIHQTNSSQILVESPAGEKSRIVLADGTHVWLNSGTILKYDVSTPRKVDLDGEAYFDVVKDQSQPFEVAIRSGMKVTVLGTKFNLRSYATEKNIETTLEEGSIVISGIISKPVTLSPGQQANYDTGNNKLQIKNVTTEIYSLWKNNELRFTNISFAELVPRIERWYGVKIKLPQNINGSDRFTLTIKTESLRELLQMMQLTSNFDYAVNGEKVIIQAK